MTALEIPKHMPETPAGPEMDDEIITEAEQIRQAFLAALHDPESPIRKTLRETLRAKSEAMQEQHTAIRQRNAEREKAKSKKMSANHHKSRRNIPKPKVDEP